MTPGRQFRARQIEDAQHLAYAKSRGWVPTKYVDKATRSAEHKDYVAKGAWTEEGVLGLQDMLSEKRRVRQTPYNPAKGLTGKYDPVTGGLKERGL